MEPPLIETVALRRLEESSKSFRAANRHLDALECMERALVLRRRMYGANSAEFWGPAQVAGELCNLLALSYLQKEDFARVDGLLRRAEALTLKDPVGRAVTYNNYACYMRQIGKLHTALAFMRKALALEQRVKQCHYRADTHINICSILSQLHKHEEALEHAKLAMDLVSGEVFGGAAAAVAAGPGGVMAAVALSPPERIAVLCIAYHNFGVENEFCRQYTQALKAYTKGADIAKAMLGEGHGITQMVKGSQLAAAKTITLERKRIKAEEQAKAAAAMAAAVDKIKAGLAAAGGGGADKG